MCPSVCLSVYVKKYKAPIHTYKHAYNNAYINSIHVIMHIYTYTYKHTLYLYIYNIAIFAPWSKHVKTRCMCHPTDPSAPTAEHRIERWWFLQRSGSRVHVGRPNSKWIKLAYEGVHKWRYPKMVGL